MGEDGKTVLTAEHYELMVKVLYILNNSEGRPFNRLRDILRSDPIQLEFCLIFLRQRMFIYAETIPGTLYVVYKISQRGQAMLSIIKIHLMNEW